MICGVYTPLAKIYLPSFKSVSKDGSTSIVTLEDLVENPTRILDPKEDIFKVFIPFSTRAFEFTYMRSREIRDPLVFEFLTATRTAGMNECDSYGVVPFLIESDVIADTMAAMEDEEEIVRQKRKSEILESIEVAKKASHAKVMRAIRNTVNNFKDERQRLAEEGKGRTYVPSDTEILATFILSDEMNNANNKRKALMDKFNFAMDAVTEKI